MRHRVKGRKLGRTASHRRATLKSLSAALLLEHRIETTVAKAKELRTYIEPLITRAKNDTTHNRRTAFSYLQNKYAVTELFNVVAPAAADRPGGYTRVLKLGFRLGDAAEMAVIELVDFNDVKPEGKEDKKKRTRRAGKTASAGKAAGQSQESIEPDLNKEEAPVTVEEVKADSTGDVTEVESENPEGISSETKEPDKSSDTVTSEDKSTEINATAEPDQQADSSESSEKKEEK